MQENEGLAAQLIDIQKELAVTQDELFVAEESLRIETDRHLVTQRELEEANTYIDILIDEKYSFISLSNDFGICTEKRIEKWRFTFYQHQLWCNVRCH